MRLNINKRLNIKKILKRGEILKRELIENALKTNCVFNLARKIGEQSQELIFRRRQFHRNLF